MTKREIVYRDPQGLVPYEHNSRTHTEDQIDKIRASIREFGFTNPILLKDDGATIGAGHARYRAAIAEGLVEVPTIVLDGLTEAQWRAYVIADNQLALTGSGWDDAILQRELDALKALDFDLALTGLDDDDLNALIARAKGQNTRDADAEAPEPPADPVSQLGDIWQLGAHRIICGDSTNAEVVAALLGDEKPHLMVTDPPYGVEYDADWRNHTGDLGRSARATGKVENDDRADWSEAWKLFPGDVAYVWHAGNKGHIVAESLIETGLLIRSQIIWNKNQLVIGRGDYHPKHEPCWYAVRKGRKGHWNGDRKQTTVWDIDKPRRSETGHSTQKPVECMRRPIENNSKPGDAIYEPFSGSGTTIIAGEQMGRRVFAIELNESYVDVACLRWAEYTGLKPILLATGQDWDEVYAERLSNTHGTA